MPFYILCHIYDYREKTQNPIAHIHQHGPQGICIHPQHGVIQKMHPLCQNSCKNISAQQKQNPQKQLISGIKTVNRKIIPASEPVSSGLHGICSFHRIFQRPGRHDRKDFHAVLCPCKHIAVCHITANAFLGIGNFLNLIFKPWHKTKHHG